MINTHAKLTLLSIIIASLFSSSVLYAEAKNKYSRYVDSQGEITFPEGFQTSMVHLGSWYVPEGDASGFHDVYTEKESVKAFRKTGEFPDGATLVKVLRESSSGGYTTGANVNYATSEIKQWFVMVKDAKQHFPGNSQWGDGWGWALFKPSNTDQNVVKDYTADCLGCHIPARDQDWVYTEAYPLLRPE